MSKVWLVRKSDGRILRPMTEDGVIQKIEAGELHPQDELSLSMHYWFSLSEVQEVREHFGDLNLEKLFPITDSEITRTQNTQILETSGKVVLDRPIEEYFQDHSVPEYTGSTIADTPILFQSTENSPLPSPEHRAEVLKNWRKVGILFIAFGVLLMTFWFGLS